jgi:hypothetical protein
MSFSGQPGSGVDKDIYDVFTAALSTNEQIRDNRESTSFNVRLASLDIGILNSALRPNSGPNNGPFAGGLPEKISTRSSTITR